MSPLKLFTTYRFLSFANIQETPFVLFFFVINDNTYVTFNKDVSENCAIFNQLKQDIFSTSEENLKRTIIETNG
jgi:hypothetical protein